MRRIFVAHDARYPHWALDDIYKLIHQAALDSEHAVSDEAHARDWLTRELAGLGAGPEEPLIEPTSPGNEVVRVHLRPFVRLRLEGEQLLGAFIRTASGFQGSANRIVEYAETAANFAREDRLPFGGDEVTQFVARMKEAGFPAIHHSPAFEAEYCPACRVVARHELPPEIIAAAFYEIAAVKGRYAVVFPGSASKRAFPETSIRRRCGTSKSSRCYAIKGLTTSMAHVSHWIQNRHALDGTGTQDSRQASATPGLSHLLSD